MSRIPQMAPAAHKPAPATVAYIALGANLGDAAQAVRDAIEAIANLPQVQVTRQSSLYRTAAQESDPASPDYINAVVEVLSTQPPNLLLCLLQKIEQSAGRERPFRNAPRTLDLDILLYGDAQIQTDTLTVPHPRMWQRAFVLRPLAEIAPQLVSAEQLSAVADQRAQKIDPLRI